MGWRPGEVWFDVDVLWFREQGGELALAGAADLGEPGPLVPVETGLNASRRRRAAAAAERRRRRATRTVPAIALVLGSATMLPIAALGAGRARPRSTKTRRPSRSGSATRGSRGSS